MSRDLGAVPEAASSLSSRNFACIRRSCAGTPATAGCRRGCRRGSGAAPATPDGPGCGCSSPRCGRAPRRGGGTSCGRSPRPSPDRSREASGWKAAWSEGTGEPGCRFAAFCASPRRGHRTSGLVQERLGKAELRGEELEIAVHLDHEITRRPHSRPFAATASSRRGKPAPGWPARSAARVVRGRWPARR